MSDSSELGAIDPQIWLNDGRGNCICHSVLNYLDAYNEVTAVLNERPNDRVGLEMLQKFDPTTLRKFRTVRDRARTFAENQLKRQALNFSKIASDLMDTNKFPSHGQMIGWEAAKNMGLNIEYLPMKDATWQRYWELYCHLRLAITENQKIFESSYASLVFDG
jgi:hypothetical protein